MATMVRETADMHLEGEGRNQDDWKVSGAYAILLNTRSGVGAETYAAGISWTLSLLFLKRTFRNGFSR